MEIRLKVSNATVPWQNRRSIGSSREPGGLSFSTTSPPASKTKLQVPIDRVQTSPFVDPCTAINGIRANSPATPQQVGAHNLLFRMTWSGGSRLVRAAAFGQREIFGTPPS